MDNQIVINLSNISNVNLDINSTELIQCLAHLCLQLQTEFDIPPHLLDRMINDPEFEQCSQFIYQHNLSEMNEQLNQFKTTFNANTNYDIHTSEYEKCGKIIKINPNTYIEYCNYHKYMHPHPDMMTEKTQIEHQFVIKDAEQIIKERYHESIYTIYKNAMNRIYQMIKSLFYYLLTIWCQIQSIQIQPENSTQLTDLIKRMENDSNIFKSKVLYEKTQTSDDLNDKLPITSFFLKLYQFKH